MNKDERFNHDYPGCSRTYATLCIYHNTSHFSEVTKLLKIEPDRTISRGDNLFSGRKADSSGWFWGTRNKCSSKDLMAHIDWLLKEIKQRKKEIDELSHSGFEMKIMCFWESINGNGGPSLDHNIISLLSEYPFDLYFDIYFDIEVNGNGS